MKRLQDIVETFTVDELVESTISTTEVTPEPKSEAEKDFVAKHKTEKHGDHEGNDSKLFNASNIKKASYKKAPGADRTANEETEGSLDEDCPVHPGYEQENQHKRAMWNHAQSLVSQRRISKTKGKKANSLKPYDWDKEQEEVKKEYKKNVDRHLEAYPHEKKYYYSEDEEIDFDGLELNELSKETLKNYIKKSVNDVGMQAHDRTQIMMKDKSPTGMGYQKNSVYQKAKRNHMNRVKGINKAADRLSGVSYPKGHPFGKKYSGK